LLCGPAAYRVELAGARGALKFRISIFLNRLPPIADQKSLSLLIAGKPTRRKC